MPGLRRATEEASYKLEEVLEGFEVLEEQPGSGSGVGAISSWCFSEGLAPSLLLFRNILGTLTQQHGSARRGRLYPRQVRPQTQTCTNPKTETRLPTAQGVSAAGSHNAQ